MTIIYIHGVKVRSAEHGVELQKPFRRRLTNKLAVNGAAPGYEPVYWGDVAAKFRWNLESRPKRSCSAWVVTKSSPDWAPCVKRAEVHPWTSRRFRRALGQSLARRPS
jgi:hypothetical protein